MMEIGFGIEDKHFAVAVKGLLILKIYDEKGKR